MDLNRNRRMFLTKMMTVKSHFNVFVNHKGEI